MVLSSDINVALYMMHIYVFNVYSVAVHIKIYIYYDSGKLAVEHCKAK